MRQRDAIPFREIAAVAVDDGIVFDPASVTVEEIRKEAGYGGVRVVIAGELAKARCKTQIDVVGGFHRGYETQKPLNARSGQALQRFLDQPFGLRIQSGGGLVEQENSGILQNGSRNGDTLALTA